MKMKFNTRRYVRALDKNKVLLLFITVIGFAIAILCNYKLKDDKYMAMSSVYINTQPSEYSTQPMEDNINYVDVIVSKRIADNAAMIIGDERVTGERILKMLKCEYSKESPVYKIYATSIDSQLSMMVANAVAEAFVVEINDILGKNNAQIWDEAYKFEMVVNARVEQARNVVCITLIGFIVAILINLAMAIRTTKVETVDDVTLNGELEILGVIPNFDVD